MDHRSQTLRAQPLQATQSNDQPTPVPGYSLYAPVCPATLTNVSSILAGPSQNVSTSHENLAANLAGALAQLQMQPAQTRQPYPQMIPSSQNEDHLRQTVHHTSDMPEWGPHVDAHGRHRQVTSRRAIGYESDQALAEVVRHQRNQVQRNDDDLVRHTADIQRPRSELEDQQERQHHDRFWLEDHAACLERLRTDLHRYERRQEMVGEGCARMSASLQLLEGAVQGQKGWQRSATDTLATQTATLGRVQETLTRYQQEQQDGRSRMMSEITQLHDAADQRQESRVQLTNLEAQMLELRRLFSELLARLDQSQAGLTSLSDELDRMKQWAASCEDQQRQFGPGYARLTTKVETVVNASKSMECSQREQRADVAAMQKEIAALRKKVSDHIPESSPVAHNVPHPQHHLGSSAEPATADTAGLRAYVDCQIHAVEEHFKAHVDVLQDELRTVQKELASERGRSVVEYAPKPLLSSGTELMGPVERIGGGLGRDQAAAPNATHGSPASSPRISVDGTLSHEASPDVALGSIAQSAAPNTPCPVSPGKSASQIRHQDLPVEDPLAGNGGSPSNEEVPAHADTDTEHGGPPRSSVVLVGPEAEPNDVETPPYIQRFADWSG